MELTQVSDADAKLLALVAQLNVLADHIAEHVFISASDFPRLTKSHANAVELLEVEAVSPSNETLYRLEGPLLSTIRILLKAYLTWNLTEIKSTELALKALNFIHEYIVKS
mmetsp:Transcript_5791/g.10326  ORF Transcript_5791/g.10326 Transcript_5791/m.10326 type:complete len:111 (+) Transcript_5791:527-859(+)